MSKAKDIINKLIVLYSYPVVTNEDLKLQDEILKEAADFIKTEERPENGQLKRIAELKRDKEDLIFIRNQNAKCMCEDKERLTKARALLEQWLQTTHAGACDNVNLAAETEQFLAGNL